MSVGGAMALVLAIAVAGFFFGRWRALALVDGNSKDLHSRPGYYGWYALTLAVIPAIFLLLLWLFAGEWVVDRIVLSELPAAERPQDDSARQLFLERVRQEGGDIFGIEADRAVEQARVRHAQLMALGSWLVTALAATAAFIGLLAGVQRARPDFRARNAVERVVLILLVACSAIAILTTLGIVLSVLFESLRFFSRVPPTEFLFGLQWSPQTAIREDQVGSSGAFGAVPLFAGTLLISAIALIVAVPVGLMSAVYMTQYASKRFRSVAKPILEILAGVPTVVYGFFAALTVAPFIRDFGRSIGLDVASESALAAGLVMGIMIIPFMSSLSDDAITAVPAAMRDGALALGATTSETIIHVLFPAALPGIVGAFLLAASRAIGETMIVVMAAGLAANLTANPLEAVTTVTVQIVVLLTGDQEFDSAKTLAAFALGLVLFLITLLLNILALRVVRKYRESYE